MQQATIMSLDFDALIYCEDFTAPIVAPADGSRFGGILRWLILIIH